MKASDLFVKSLENEGVEYIFAVPGEENIDLSVDYSLNHSILNVLIKQKSQEL